MFIESFKEECHHLLTNKMYGIVLFLLPILTVILIGIELSGGVITNIPMAIIDYDQSSFSRQLIDSFDQNETFNITNYPSTEEALETLMKNSQIRAGIIIPKDFYSDIVALKSPIVLMIYDGSHMSFASTAKAKATEILLTYKAGATIKQLTGKLNMSYQEAFNIAQAFQFNNRMLYNPSKSFEDFLAPILMAGLIQVAIVLIATASIDPTIFLKTKRKRIGYASGKILFYTLSGSLSFMICILLQVYGFHTTFSGNLIDAFLLSAGLSFSVSACCVLISSSISNRMVTLIIGAILFLPNSIMAGTTWPLLSMPAGYQGFAKYIPFTHYVNNLRDIYLKGATLQQFMSDAIYLFKFGLIVLILSELIVFISANVTHSEEATYNALS